MTKLSEADTNKIISYLKEKWAGRPCPMCQTGNWVVQDSCFQIMTYHSGNLVLGGPVIPLIPITCNNCSNTILLNAILAGVIKPSEESKSENKSENSIDEVGKSV
jgi:hypothetical protein